MFLVIACIYDDENKTLEGYRVVDLNSLHTTDIMLQTFKARTKQYHYLIPDMQFMNAYYWDIANALASNGPTLISDYAHITKDYRRLTNDTITVAGIIDDINGNEVGVIAFNAIGQMARLTFADFIKAINKKEITNYKLVNNRPYPNNNMTDFPHIRMQQQGVNRTYRSAEGEQKPDIAQDNNTNTQVTQTVQQPVTPTPKRRGRPPKNANTVSVPPLVENNSVSTVTTNVEPPKKKRGRPSKKDVNQNNTTVINENTVDSTNNTKLVPTNIVEAKEIEEVVSKGPFCKSNDSLKLPTIKITHLDNYVDDELNLSAQQKFLLANLNFKKMSLYFASIYEAIDKVNKPGLGTFGVTEKKMYYDYAFAADLQVSELVFVLIHEMMHIAFMHSVRKGGRDSYLWNIATDLYINTIICMDWNIHYGGPENVLIPEDLSKKTIKVAIKCPPDGIFLDTIDETLDLSKDTPETIYDRLVKENPDLLNRPKGGQGQQGQPQQGQNQQGQNQQGQGQSQQGQNQQGENQQGQNQQGQQGQNQQGQQGQNQQGQGQQGQNQQGQGQQGQNQQGQGDGQQNNDDSMNKSGSSGSSSSFDNSEDEQQNNGQGGKSDSKQNDSDTDKNQGTGLGDDSEEDANDNQSATQENSQNGDAENGQGEEGIGNTEEVSVVYNGKIIKGRIMVDVCTERNENDASTVDKNVADMKRTLTSIDTKLRLAADKYGIDELTRTYGKGGNLVERHIEYGLSEGIDWRLLLRNICREKPNKMYVRNRPNKNRLSLGVYLPTEQEVGEPTQAGNFVVAIDVSGSISQQKLNYFLSDVAKLCKKYDVDGELIYWSTTVGDSGKFSKLQDLQKVKPKSTGGTDVKCVFEYLLGYKTTDTGKKEELPVRDIKGVFIITDGYFAENYGKYAEVFDRRVVWLIDGNPVMFNRLFGRVLGLEYAD